MSETIMKIKRVLTFLDEVRSDAGHDVSPRLRKAAAVAVLDNPFTGRFEKDPSSLTKASEVIGREICTIAVQLLAPEGGKLRQGGDRGYQR
jgi:Amino acid synthesis